MVKIRIESDTEVAINEKARAVIAFVYAPESMEEADEDRTATQVVMQGQGQGNHMRMLMDAATGLSSLIDTAVTDPIDQMMLRALMMKKIQESAKKSAEVVVQKAERNKVVPDTMKNEGRAPWDA